MDVDLQRIRLWHGTTLSASLGIVADGWERQDSRSLVAALANEHGVDANAVWSILAERGRFIAVTEERDNLAWFTGTPEAAAQYAGRAPEARWEALWAIWIAKHAITDAWFAPWNDPEAASWHWRQQLVDQPVVVVADVPAAYILGETGKPLSSEQIATQLALIEEFRLSTDASYSPNFSLQLPLQSSSFVDVVSVPRRVDRATAAGLLGITVEALIDRIQRGSFPTPVCEPGNPVDVSWAWDDVKSILALDA